MKPVCYLIGTTCSLGLGSCLLGLFGGFNHSVIARGVYLLFVTSILTTLLISRVVLQSQ